MESQSLTKCFELREACQEKIFTKMDEQHTVQMEALGSIQMDLSYKKGQENGRREDDDSDGSKMNWNRLFFKVAVMWGPPFLFIVVLGCIYWLKASGWL